MKEHSGFRKVLAGLRPKILVVSHLTRRPIQWPIQLKAELQQVQASDIVFSRPAEKAAQVHCGTYAVVEDLTRSFHQAELHPSVRNLFVIMSLLLEEPSFSE